MSNVSGGDVGPGDGGDGKEYIPVSPGSDSAHINRRQNDTYPATGRSTYYSAGSGKGGSQRSSASSSPATTSKRNVNKRQTSTESLSYGSVSSLSSQLSPASTVSSVGFQSDAESDISSMGPGGNKYRTVVKLSSDSERDKLFPSAAKSSHSNVYSRPLSVSSSKPDSKPLVIRHTAGIIEARSDIPSSNSPSLGDNKNHDNRTATTAERYEKSSPGVTRDHQQQQSKQTTAATASASEKRALPANTAHGRRHEEVTDNCSSSRQICPTKATQPTNSLSTDRNEANKEVLLIEHNKPKPKTSTATSPDSSNVNDDMVQTDSHNNKGATSADIIDSITEASRGQSDIDNDKSPKVGSDRANSSSVEASGIKTWTMDELGFIPSDHAEEDTSITTTTTTATETGIYENNGLPDPNGSMDTDIITMADEDIAPPLPPRNPKLSRAMSANSFGTVPSHPATNPHSLPSLPHNNSVPSFPTHHHAHNGSTGVPSDISDSLESDTSSLNLDSSFAFSQHKFHMDQQIPSPPATANGATGETGPHNGNTANGHNNGDRGEAEAHPFLVGQRNILKPDDAKVSKIISSKGTVRGLKNLVKAGIASFVEKQEGTKNYRQIEKGKVVVYTTSVTIVRDRYERCIQVKKILHTHMVKFEERDIFMARDNQRELNERLGTDKMDVPQVFADGQHIGGFEELERMNEVGELRTIFKQFQRVNPTTSCAQCGGYRYTPCPACHGSKKSQNRNYFIDEFCALRCTTCDENGLVRCELCASDDVIAS